MRSYAYRPSPTICPKCEAESPCTDWQEVDIGVGVQVFDEEWTCPEHGEFGFSHFDPDRPRYQRIVFLRGTVLEREGSEPWREVARH